MSEIYQQDPDTNEWEPAVPLPLYISRWLGLVKRFGCVCRAEFRTKKEYEDHYRGWHILVGEDESGATRFRGSGSQAFSAPSQQTVLDQDGLEPDPRIRTEEEAE